MPEQSADSVLKILASLIADKAGGMFGNATNEARGDKARSAADRKYEAEVRKAEAASKGMRYTTDILPKKLHEAFTKSGSEFVNNLARGVKSIEDVLKFEDQASAMKEVAAELDRIGNATFTSKENMDAGLRGLEKIANEAGLTLESMGVKTSRTWDLTTKKAVYFVNNQKATTEKLNKKSEELSEALSDARTETVRHTESVERSRAEFNKFKDSVKSAAKEALKFAEQEQRFAQQTATADAGWITGMYQMGISQLEYMKILKETRVESLAANSANVDFKNSLYASQESLKRLTSDYNEAAKVAGMFHKNMAKIGVSQEHLGDAVLQQTKIYEENYRALGYTAEQFANLSADLINDQGMRDVLLTLKEKERKSYVLGIQQRMAEYQAMGFTIDRAKALQKTFQGLVGMDPKERMKKAAKKRAMLGAIGMGAEAQELFRLETTYRTLNAEQKASADIRMAEIQAQSAKIFGQMSGSGTSLGQSMAMQMMAQKTGFDSVIQATETVSGEGLKFDKIMLGETQEINDIVSKILGLMSQWGSLLNSSLGSLATNLITGIGGVIAGVVGTNMLSKLIGGGGPTAIIGKAATAATGALKASGSVIASVLTSGAVTAAAGAAAAGAAGYGAGTLAYDYALSDNIKVGIGDAIGSVVDNVMGFVFDNDAAKNRLSTIAKNKEIDELNTKKSEEQAMASNNTSSTSIFNQAETEKESLVALMELTKFLRKQQSDNMTENERLRSIALAAIETTKHNQMQGRRSTGS